MQDFFSGRLRIHFLTELSRAGGLEALRKAFEKQEGEEYESYCECLGVKTLDFDSFDAEKINADMKSKIKLLKSMWHEE